MKNHLQTLLIFVALSLCVLCAFQWHRESKLQAEVQSLRAANFAKEETIKKQTTATEASRQEIAQLAEARQTLSAIVKSNQVLITELEAQLTQSLAEGERALGLVRDHKAALEQANATISRQNADIQKQNDLLKQLSDERNAVVTKYNELMQEYNALAKRWNEQQGNSDKPPSE